MRAILLLLGLVIGSQAAHAESWVTIRADHENLLYTEGERAIFTFEKEGRPVDKNFSLDVYVNHAGKPQPVKLNFQGRYAFYKSPVLTAGVFPLEVKAYLVGPNIPPSPPWKELVQDQMVELQVNENE